MNGIFFSGKVIGLIRFINFTCNLRTWNNRNTLPIEALMNERVLVDKEKGRKFTCVN